MLVITFFLFFSFSITAQFSEQFKISIQERVDLEYTPSIAVGVIDSNGMHFYNYGKTKNENGKSVDEQTIYEIGSISKVFTSFLLAKMVEEGKMSLDDPIDKYLPDLEIPNYEGTKITLKHLATHNSGLPRLPKNLNIGENPEDPYAKYDDNMLVDFLESYELPFEPGTKYQYSNLGAGLLGYILAKENRMTLEDLFYEKIGKKIKAENTKINLTKEQKEQLGFGHAGGDIVPNWNFRDALEGGGAFKSNIVEMLSFMKTQLYLEGNKPSYSVKLTHKLQAEIGTKIGLGWHFYKKNIRWHNGGTGGYRSFCGIDLEKNRGVVILANSTYSVDDLGLHLLDDSKEILKPKAIAKVNSKIYKDYVGKYIVGGIMAMNVTTKNGKLYFQLFGQPAYRIYPESKTLYFMLGLDVEFEFVRDENGEVNSIIFEQNSYKQMAKRVKE